MTELDEKIVVARTNGAYGVRGWVRIVPFENGEALINTKRWWLITLAGEILELHVTAFKPHGTILIARFEGCDNKEDADALRGRIAVAREDFPELDDDEHWAIDVIGCRVVNREGIELGRITDIGDNGVQDVFKVEGGPLVEGKAPVYLIPDVEQYILKIDTDSELVTVDWQPDWL